jgi:TPP-dependent pyruvate/acetoin dehydrogenase alpha subunit
MMYRRQLISIMMIFRIFLIGRYKEIMMINKILNQILHDSMTANVQKMINETGLEHTWEAIQHLKRPSVRARFKQVYMELTGGK